jgi:hypothetical protein
MAIPVETFVRELTASHRVVVLGGLAVIAHGLSRHTQDADVWLEPMGSAEEWGAVVEGVCHKVRGTTVHRLPGWTEVSGAALAEAADETGVVRICGLSVPLDIFRRPNEFLELEFDEVAARAHRNADGSLLPDPIDLIQSKQSTGRDKDRYDIQHLESLVRADYRRQLPTATPAEAAALLGRYSDWEVLQSAMENPAPEVRELALSHLREFAAEGDPFSLAILEGRALP